MEVQTTLNCKEIVTTRFAMGDKAAQATTASAEQASMAGYSTGAFGLDSDAHMTAMFNLLKQIRDTLVANGMMKGSA